MKKFFILVLISISLLLVASYFIGLPNASADTMGGTVELPNPIQSNTFKDLINSILNFIWGIVLVATPVMIVIGGIIMVTSAGNPEQVKTGKNTIIWSLAGFALIILAKGLFALIKTMIGVS